MAVNQKLPKKAMDTQNEQITPIKRFWRLLKPDQKEIVNIYVFAIFSGLISLSLPLGIQSIINFVQGARMSTSFIVLVSFVIAGVAASGVLQVYQLRIAENLQQKIFTRAAFEFTFRLPRIKAEALYRYYAPELMNRFFDTVSIQKGLSKILIDFSTALLQGVFGLILLSFYHPFFIAFSIGLALLAYAIFAFTFRGGMKTSLLESKHKYQVAHWLEELARTVYTFKMAGDSDLPLNRVNTYTKDYLKAREGHFKILLRQFTFMVGFKVLVAAGLLIIGSLLVIDQQMNIGQFVAAEIIILLVMNSVEKLILAMETIYDVLTSLEKVGQVTDLELEEFTGIEIKDMNPEGGFAIDLNDCEFSYPQNKTSTLSELSLHIDSNQSIMISGPTESGKLTLLQLIAGIYQPQKGTVAYDGIPQGNFCIEDLRSHIGSYFHNDDIFEGSLLDNISMGRKNVSLDDVRWACSNLGLNPFIQQLPEGFNSHLDPEGRKLPKTIAQKILLARSIAHKPRLLLLKDPYRFFSSTESEKLTSFLTDKSQSWTLIIATNNLKYAAQSDQIIILDKGEISKVGTFSELKDSLNKNAKNHA